MSASVTIRLAPLGVEFNLERGTSLETALFNHGVEFPCGGAGTCGGCRVRVLDGDVDATSADRDLLTSEQLAGGWRLACHLSPLRSLTLFVEQWNTPVLADFAVTTGGQRQGLGVAVDLGTTTLVVQLVDLASGNVLAVRTALNPQSAYGADIMSRVERGLKDARLTQIIRGTIVSLLDDLLAGRAVEDIVLVGNTVMHHIFCGLDVEPLSHVPFHSPNLQECAITVGQYRMRFLRCLGGFVGSDILAGIVATGLHRTPQLSALIDLGTNGEIVVGNCHRQICASTAAGPAFEAGRIGAGMRASTGAVSHVSVHQGGFVCRVIGDVPPRGICGSGLVDAVAAGLDLEAIRPNGRLANGTLHLCDNVGLSQSDIRELQLAKGAIAAGLTMLLKNWGADLQDLQAVFLAGAFGNYVDVASARRIGLLPVDPSRVQACGNSALRGARMLLLNPEASAGICVEHMELAADAEFQDRFAEALGFPSGVYVV